MVATPIARTQKYINPGTTKIYFCTTIANKNSPTRPELDAGTDLSREVQGCEGWLVSSAQAEAPNLDEKFTGTIPGRTNAEESSLTFYADKTGADARAILPRDTEGFIVWMDGGDVPNSLMDVFPIRVASVGKTRNVEGEDPATVPIQFAITSEPAENIAIPAAA